MKKIFSNDWVKCIAVLLIIALVSGGLLTVLNDLLYVSSEERTGRAIKKIYGEVKEYTVVLDSENGDDAVEYDFGKIEKIYQIENDTLFRATGYNGYKNGTITLWVKTVKDGDGYKIDKVILESYDKQTLMSKLDKAYYDGFLKDVTDTYYTVDAGSENSNPVTGATKSASAGVHAVNCVVKYLNEKAGE